MAINPNTVLALELGRFYKGVAFEISEYIYHNISTIPKDQLTKLFDDETRISTYANTFFSLAENLVFSDDTQIVSLTNATEEVNIALKKIKKLNKIINISASVITLATAILNGNPQTIAKSVAEVIGAATKGDE